MDNGELLARLEKIDSDPIGAGLARNWHRNPDGPEAAALIRQYREALRPFVELADARDAAYRKRGGNMDDFPDTHPAYDISAYDLKLGVFRKARALLGERGE